MTTPLNLLTQAMRANGMIRFLEYFEEQFPSSHLKDLTVEEILPGRRIRVRGRTVVNFGSDSFLGLDEHPRVQEAIRRGLQKWGSHNGASRAFSSVEANIEAETKLADWLGTEAVLIYPSVTLANVGALPGLVGKPDLIAVEQQAHNSIQEAAKIARAGGTNVLTFAPCKPEALDQALQDAEDYRVAVVALDGVYSMSGALPPLADLNEVARRRRAVLYVDDAHASGVIGQAGRGTVLQALGNYDNVIVVGSLSKGFSCAGGFIGCSHEMKRLLKMRSTTYIFGGPVPPPYLEAVSTVCDLLRSEEGETLLARLQDNLRLLKDGLDRLGMTYTGGVTPIVSVLIGGEEDTLLAGHQLFEQGFYVQSVTFPAVPYHAGVLRIQINANHLPQTILQLVDALDQLWQKLPLAQPQSQVA